MIDTHEEVKAALRSSVPAHILPGIDRYVEQHIEPGGFLMAVFENDLKGAFGRADETNRARLFDIVAYVYNCTPLACQGSPEKVDAWLKLRGATVGKDVAR
jgi:hypothetical protein